MPPPRNSSQESNQKLDKDVCTKVFMTSLLITERRKQAHKRTSQDGLLGCHVNKVLKARMTLEPVQDKILSEEGRPKTCGHRTISNMWKQTMHTHKEDWKETCQNVSRAYSFSDCASHLFFIYFNWCIVDLQSCRCTAKWLLLLSRVSCVWLYATP